MSKIHVLKSVLLSCATLSLVACQSNLMLGQTAPQDNNSLSSGEFQIQAVSKKPVKTSNQRLPLMSSSTPKPPLASLSPSPSASVLPTPLPSTSASPLPSATPSPSASVNHKLNIVLELHVENPMLPTDQETDYLLQIAQAAHQSGVKLSIGLGVSFLNDYQSQSTIQTHSHGAFTLSSLVQLLQNSYGHKVSLHADIPETANYSEIIHYLPPYIRQINEAGGTGRVASGVCNESNADGGWVKGALDSGLTAVGGVVEYCQASLNSDDSLWLNPNTTTPSRNHNPAPNANPQQRAQGWFVQSVAHWVSPWNPGNQSELNQALMIIGSMSEAHPVCLEENKANSTCGSNTSAAQAQADAQALLNEVSQTLDAYLSGTAGDAYHTAFSTNLVVSQEWLDSYFVQLTSGIASQTSSGGKALSQEVQFSTLPEIEQMNRQEIASQF